MTTTNARSPLGVALIFLCAFSAMACGDDGGADETVADLDCDALLTTADFESVCGSSLTLEATAFEGIALNPCNRDAMGNEALLLVSRHTSPAVAEMAETEAGGRGPTLQDGLGLYASAGAVSVFLVEVKATSEAAALCSPDKLPLLLDIATSRIAP